MDLGECLWGNTKKSVAQITNLIEHIPLSGAFGKRIGALEAQNWQNQEELMAVIAELIDINNRIHLQINAKKGTPEPKAIKIPRPWDKPPQKRIATSADMKAIFGGSVEFVPAERI